MVSTVVGLSCGPHLGARPVLVLSCAGWGQVLTCWLDLEDWVPSGGSGGLGRLMSRGLPSVLPFPGPWEVKFLGFRPLCLGFWELPRPQRLAGSWPTPVVAAVWPQGLLLGWRGWRGSKWLPQVTVLFCWPQRQQTVMELEIGLWKILSGTLGSVCVTLGVARQGHLDVFEESHGGRKDSPKGREGCIWWLREKTYVRGVSLQLPRARKADSGSCSWAE